jgi:hypothetical protein
VPVYGGFEMDYPVDFRGDLGAKVELSYFSLASLIFRLCNPSLALYRSTLSYGCVLLWLPHPYFFLLNWRNFLYDTFSKSPESLDENAAHLQR